MISPRVWFVVGAIVLLLLAAAVILLGRALRSQVGTGSQAGARRGSPDRQWAVTPLPTGLARTLTERGLVNAQQLASMSPAEREFFVATVAARVGEGGKPKLVGAQPNGNGSGGTGGPDRGQRTPDVKEASAAGEATTRTTTVVTPGDARDPAIVVDTVTTAALVSGGIHCPVCRAPLGQRSETPLLMSRCPGCGRRVAARVEGNRLTVTVQYGAPTPAAGTPAVGTPGH